MLVTRGLARCFGSVGKGRVVVDARKANTMADVTSVFEQGAKAATEGFERMVILGSPVETASTPREAASRKSLEGFTKSLAREVGRTGATVNMLYVPEELTDGEVETPVGWLLGDGFKFVSGQILPITKCNSADDRLTGKTVLVTGAAGGIGSQIARECASRGAAVVLADIPQAETALAALSRSIPSSIYVTMNVGDGSAAGEAVAGTGKRFAGVVHCAGVTLDKTLKRMPPQDWTTSLEVNLYGPIEMTAYLQSRGIVTDQTTVVGISSVIGFSGNRGQTNYSAAKHGLRSWLAALPCPAYGVAPGFIETAMTKKMPEEILKFTLSQSALERLGSPEDPANVVATLLSPAGKVFTPGQTIRVCGGFYWG